MAKMSVKALAQVGISIILTCLLHVNITYVSFSCSHCEGDVSYHRVGRLYM